MNPKKPKQLIKPTADKLGLTESLVDDVVNFYWSAVRKALSDMEGPSIAVTNLGTFKIRYKQIPVLEEKYTRHLDEVVLEKMTFNKHTMQNIAKFKHERHKEIRQEIEEEYARKDESKQKRIDYVINKSVEEQGQDSRGTQE